MGKNYYFNNSYYALIVFQFDKSIISLLECITNWKSLIQHKMPRPGLKPGLLRPQRRVLTTRRSRPVVFNCEYVVTMVYLCGTFQPGMGGAIVVWPMSRVEDGFGYQLYLSCQLLHHSRCVQARWSRGMILA